MTKTIEELEAEVSELYRVAKIYQRMAWDCQCYIEEYGIVNWDETLAEQGEQDKVAIETLTKYER
jgi:hypothetical protein|tara:strand:+ start:179 stop:373 length:195 start_codon:yes stop_codon:yes gene_type:complete